MRETMERWTKESEGKKERMDTLLDGRERERG